MFIYHFKLKVGTKSDFVDEMTINNWLEIAQIRFNQDLENS